MTLLGLQDGLLLSCSLFNSFARLKRQIGKRFQAVFPVAHLKEQEISIKIEVVIPAKKCEEVYDFE